MHRQELIDKLELVQPALSKTNLVPILQNFWFKNDHIIAYNDSIAIKVGMKSGFEGAVPPTLWSLLSASKATEVEFKVQKKGTLEVKAASSKFKIPFLEDTETWIFEMPKADKEHALQVDIVKFLAALSLVMRSSKENIMKPEYLGVTVQVTGQDLSLFATCGATLSFAWTHVAGDSDDFKVVLSPSFCKQMLSISKLEGEKHLEIHGDYSLFQCGDVVLFGRLVEVQKPLDFDGVIDSVFPKEMEKDLVSIPSKLELILDRSIVVADKKAVMEIQVENGKASFFSKSDKGEVRDNLTMEEHHPDVSVNIDPRLFRHGYGFHTKMLLTEKGLVMVDKDHNLYLVSASQ
jgi:DNA polymerase III sliding clamp (beta) subunit (PCNA family)